MKKDLLSIGPFTIHGYGFMIALGILAAFFTAQYRARKLGLDYEKIIDFVIWDAVGGILGAKILFCIVEFKSIINNPDPLGYIMGGFVVYGGIIFGILSGYLFCKKQKWNFLKYSDLGLPSVALAQAFGRIGCFLAGCCYGKETHGKLAVTFHNSDMAPNNVPLIPTQLISSALDFLNFVALVLLSNFFIKKKKVDGVITGLYLIFYSVGRYILEFYRGDLDRGSVGMFSTSQFIAIFGVLAGVILIIWRFKVPAADENLIAEEAVVSDNKETDKEDVVDNKDK